ncbi:MAG: hypothetical protein Ct9H90mP16_10330 [Candidatus Poseidoniales archaeon]|nr:MAG: hypothetical protein Ct9H90mP16_10330 [Candidatus Poseidoniales archaeon]
MDWIPSPRKFGNASHVNDVVINHLGEGRLLRTDGIHPLGVMHRSAAEP